MKFIKNMIIKIVDMKIEAYHKDLMKHRNDGEIYCKRDKDLHFYSRNSYYPSTSDYGYFLTYVPFKKHEVEEKHLGQTKIFGVWFPDEDIFYYDDVYSSIRNRITNRKRVNK